jgi:hypothetical protein
MNIGPKFSACPSCNTPVSTATCTTVAGTLFSQPDPPATRTNLELGILAEFGCSDIR